VEEILARCPVALGAFLKLAGAAATGGHAKLLVQQGDVRVNGELELRRGRKLVAGDTVAVAGREFTVCSSST
jgi:ribosome-associated protein